MIRAQALLLAVGFCMTVTTGCYTYKPVLAPRTGMDVRARLKTEAAVRRSQGMDEAIMRVDGKVVEVTPDALTLDILVVRSSSAFQNIEMRDTLRLANTEIDAILGRRFAPLRTGVFVIGSAAAVYGILKGIDQVVGGTGDEDGGGDPTFRVPLSALLSAWFVPAYQRARRE
jgi:hypothetical protein